MTLHELEHISVPITGGGEIIVLNTGAIINPEAVAMLQALHSRSIGGLKAHLETLLEKGAENFMKNFYVGYGHASIGDCGTTVIFIEGVSMLAAKAIQDWRLYSGQEASTRYIDFKTQPFMNPVGTKEGEDILENWRSFYIYAMPLLVEDLKIRYPIQEGEKEAIYDKAINARAFDILRGFLPAGSTTNLAWTTNLRQGADKLKLLRHHPLEEVRRIADALETALKQAHPNSFEHKRYENTENYIHETMNTAYYFHNPSCPEFALTKNTVDQNEVLALQNVFQNRPEKTELPMCVEDIGEIQFEFPLDFGSYRDIQRHRAVSQRMPLLTSELGFEEWYLNELPADLKKKALFLLKEQEVKVSNLKISKELSQYYWAMGYRCSCRVTGNLRALVYLIELRATRFVHKTLREKANMMAEKLQEIFPSLKLHLDDDKDRFDVKRGEHDIVMK